MCQKRDKVSDCVRDKPAKRVVTKNLTYLGNVNGVVRDSLIY